AQGPPSPLTTEGTGPSMLLLYAIAAGLILGRLRGGRVSALADLRIRWVWLAVGGLAFQMLLFSPVAHERVGSAGPPLYVLSRVVVLVALLRNLELPGLPLVAVGAFLNLAAILANGGYMPSDPAAWLALTGQASLPTDAYSNSALIGPGTALAHLGDLFV